MAKSRRPLFNQFHIEATAFLHEIVRVADCLRAARAFDGEPAMHFGARWQLLRAIERCGGAPTFADLARALQVALTPAGRRRLDAQRVPQFAWLFTLLNGLEPEAMRSTHHVLNVIRLRLERYASERRALSAASARRSRTQ
jgi:hypothetical protein